jgi:hypothetical protein
MYLELNDEQTEALACELDQLIRNDRYFLGPRIRILKEILRQATAGAGTSGAAAPTAELRAAQQGAVSEAGITSPIAEPGDHKMPDHRTVEWIIANTINDTAQGDPGRPGRPHRRRSDGSGIPHRTRQDPHRFVRDSLHEGSSQPFDELTREKRPQDAFMAMAGVGSLSR